MNYMSLTTKMTIAVTLMVMLSLSGVAYLSLSHFERAFTQTTARQQNILVTSLAEEIDLNIDLAQQEIVGMARALSGSRLDDPAALQAFLDQNLQNEPLFDGALGVIAQDGIMLAVAPLESDMVGRDFSFRPYFSETVASGQPRISAPFIPAQKNGHPIVMFTAPVFDQQGELTAVVVGAVDLLKDNFLGRIARMRLGEGGYLYVYASDRTIIVHPDSSRILQQDVPLGANPLFDRAIEGFEGSAATGTSRGLQAFSSFKHLQTRDWILAANYPLAEVFAPMAKARSYILALLAAGTLLSLLGTWLLMRHLTAPLLVFTARVKNMTEREADRTPIELGSRDEIDTLAQAFNFLLEETDNRKRALEDNLVFHQVLINTLPVPVFTKDCDGRYIGGNAALMAFLGLSKEQLLGKTAFDIVPQQQAERYHQADMELRDQDGIQVYEGRIARADGAQRDVVFTKANFTNALGQWGGDCRDLPRHYRTQTDRAGPGSSEGVFGKPAAELSRGQLRTRSGTPGHLLEPGLRGADRVQGGRDAWDREPLAALLPPPTPLSGGPAPRGPDRQQQPLSQPAALASQSRGRAGRRLVPGPEWERPLSGLQCRPDPWSTGGDSRVRGNAPGSHRASAGRGIPTALPRSLPDHPGGLSCPHLALRARWRLQLLQ